MQQLNQIIKKLKLNVLSIEDVPDSFSSTVYKIKQINQQIVYLKIPYSKVKLAREYEALEILSDTLEVPRLLEYWEGNDEIAGALLLSTIKGEPLSEKVDEKLAFDIGVNHAKLHQVAPQKKYSYKGISNVYDQWSTFLENQFYSFAEDVKDVIPEALYEQSLELFEKQRKSLPHPDGPSFIHMDFRPANIIIHENLVSGIIDFESARFGSTEMDFTKINRDIFMKNPGTLEAYQKGYQTIRQLIDLEIVLPFYRFTDAFNSIGWCKRRGIQKHQQFFDENYVTLKSILTNER
ncbi:aminoglycoside phosphotransferase family protein [Psychrobacillus lasiicapitis]|uniref:Aminoglycoside phosphotransferase family protein n=1 Tax=Psychrobacillus lasiicapitis TaxID=1636719 RepID=A0A544TAT1_9BACI|nr:aminoglycoside phosphotransferase family protein [Psychrobacillus lasiicapitis]TQR14567.1 aminoglycoside phosphotransferase family protein [Psychrobacillus lasiicapitis]